MKTYRLVLAALAATALSSAPAFAGDNLYVSLSGFMGSQSDSFNDGQFTSDFTTGQGSEIIPLGTPLPGGTDVNWNTDFKSPYGLNAAIGNSYGNFRIEGELSLEKAKVDTHTDVTAANIDLSTQDAAVLITGQATGLGVNVADLVADGQGEIKSTSLFLNAYVDFPTQTAITPYLGAGLGYGWTDVDYSPSDVAIIDDDDAGVAWQVMGGAAFDVSENGAIFGGVRYRQSSDAEVQASLIPAEFEIENKRTLFEIGYRLGF